jgi:hypothetical protein
MVLGPMVNGVVLGGCQSLNSGPQPPGQSRIGAEEPQGGALDGAGAANPTGRIERGGILDLATEFALKEFSQEPLVKAVLRTLLGLVQQLGCLFTVQPHEVHVLAEPNRFLSLRPKGDGIIGILPLPECLTVEPAGSPANEDHILQESGEDLLQQPQGCANLVPVINIQSRHISPIA